MRWLYFLLGIILLPVAAICSRACWFLLSAWWAAPGGIQAILALAVGALCWTITIALLPATARAYILAHEITHALWGTIMGARFCGMHISREGGYVKLSERNFLMALAPYFFPFYTALILLAWWICSWFVGPATGRLFWLAALGASLGFHYTFTLQALFRRQSDLQPYGLLFPYVLIYCGNVFILAILVALMAGTPLSVWTAQLSHDAQFVWTAIRQVAEWLRQSLPTFLEGRTVKI